MWREVLHKLNHYNRGEKRRGKCGGETQTKCGLLLLADVWCSHSDRLDGDWHRTKYIITETVDASNSSRYQHAIVFHTSCNGEPAARVSNKTTRKNTQPAIQAYNNTSAHKRGYSWELYSMTEVQQFKTAIFEAPDNNVVHQWREK
jgi:hypothetical protein